MAEKFQASDETLGLTILSQKQLTDEIRTAVWILLDDLKPEVEAAFGRKQIYFGSLIDTAWRTLLVHDEFGDLAAFANIYIDSNNDRDPYGMVFTAVLDDFRRRGIGTLLNKRSIELCWQSDEIVTAQFNIRWDNNASRKKLIKACQGLGIKWSEVHTIPDLVNQMTGFRIPPKN
ncbi:MAG: GNAT family N-acetyltransferase [Candidatus Peribacteraceae bacterium]|nr:GNAT family N-acetyltransferase [Candidatus Peribacteraceae bacterium]